VVCVAPAISTPFLYHWKVRLCVDVALEVKVPAVGAVTDWLKGLRAIKGSCGPAGFTVSVAVALWTDRPPAVATMKKVDPLSAPDVGGVVYVVCVAPAMGVPFLDHWKVRDCVEVADEVNVAVAGAVTDTPTGFSVMIGSCGPGAPTVRTALALLTLLPPAVDCMK